MGGEAMAREDLHISREELLSAADGEVSSHRAAQVRKHLESCWECRAQMAETEAAIVDFTRTYRQPLDPQLPPIAGPRALLRARIGELATAPKPEQRRWLPRFAPAVTVVALCGLLLTAGLAGGFAAWRLAARNDTSPQAALPGRDATPDRGLTPGATRPVSIDDVCSMAHEEVVKDVSSELRQRVFAEYGIPDAHAGDYEIDYLIAPGLGGTEDIRNLWPEPYRSPVWNAHVKDDLEERLHELVCARQLDLSTAQREISTDWIAAYKKYFHTDRPGLLHAEIGPSRRIAPHRNG
jgi:hypothetical protein